MIDDADRRIDWPPPRDDPAEEPSHPGARIADRLDEAADEPEPEDRSAAERIRDRLRGD